MCLVLERMEIFPPNPLLVPPQTLVIDKLDVAVFRILWFFEQTISEVVGVHEEFTHVPGCRTYRKVCIVHSAKTTTSVVHHHLDIIVISYFGNIPVLVMLRW